MPMLRAIRMMNAVSVGTLDGAGLETLLADTGRLGEWKEMLEWKGQARRLAQNPQAMAAVIASSTAMAAVAASSTAMAAVIASSTAMAAVIASSTAMAAVWASDAASDAVLTSSTAKLAVYNSDTALAALQANPTQIQRQIGISGRVTSKNTSSQTYEFEANGTKCILLRRYYSGTEADMIDWGRGMTTAAVGNGPSGGGRNLDTGAQALGCTSGTYTSNGTMPTTNDATGNFVSAANGLKRRSWSNGNPLYVLYIPVGE